MPAGKATIPYVWVTGEDREQFDSVLEREQELTEFEAIDEIDSQTLYRVEWDPSVDTFVQMIARHDGVLMQASGDDEVWEFQLRFPDSHSLSEFHTACRKADIDVTVERLYNPIEPRGGKIYGLTEAQRMLVEYAYDEGYFSVPRKVTLAEPANQLEISDQAVNERLRRGLEALIASTLKAETDEND